MHICVVAGTFHPETGGPPTYLYHLLPELIQRGHTLEVVTYTNAPRGGRGSSKIFPSPYPVYRISRKQSIPARLFAFTWQILCVGRRADAIFVSDYGLPAALANIILRKPLVLKNVSDFAWEFSTRHGWLRPSLTIEEFQTSRHSLRVRLLRWLQALYVGVPRVVIVPSRYMAGIVSGWGVPPNQLRLIYNALDHRLFVALPSRTEARRELALPEQAPVLLTVARLTPWKGIDALIRSLPIVQQDFPAVQLLIIGDGPERPRLNTQAAALKGGVSLLGVKPRAEVYRYLRAADVFILFSSYEGLPHTILEAMAAGTPVIASCVGGNGEVIEHERTGLLVPPGDDTDLARGITRLLADPTLGRKLTKAAQTSLDRFSWERLVAETEAALLEAVASG